MPGGEEELCEHKSGKTFLAPIAGLNHGLDHDPATTRVGVEVQIL